MIEMVAVDASSTNLQMIRCVLSKAPPVALVSNIISNRFRNMQQPEFNGLAASVTSSTVQSEWEVNTPSRLASSMVLTPAISGYSVRTHTV